MARESPRAQFRMDYETLMGSLPAEEYVSAIFERGIKTVHMIHAFAESVRNARRSSDPAPVVDKSIEAIIARHKPAIREMNRRERRAAQN